ncbi:MAG: YccF domain-containing protein [Caldilineales bacterium]
MSFLGNVIWFIFGGFLAGIGYILGGLGMCLTIVGIPFGVQNIKLGVAMFAPFGKQIVQRDNANTPLRVLLNIIWLVLFGWEIALAHLLLGLVLCITVVGIPFGVQHLKMIPLALLPFGRDLLYVAPLPTAD